MKKIKGAICIFLALALLVPMVDSSITVVTNAAELPYSAPTRENLQGEWVHRNGDYVQHLFFDGETAIVTWLNFHHVAHPEPWGEGRFSIDGHIVALPNSSNQSRVTLALRVVNPNTPHSRIALNSNTMSPLTNHGTAWERSLLRYFDRVENTAIDPMFAEQVPQPTPQQPAPQPPTPQQPTPQQPTPQQPVPQQPTPQQPTPQQPTPQQPAPQQPAPQPPTPQQPTPQQPTPQQPVPQQPTPQQPVPQPPTPQQPAPQPPTPQQPAPQPPTPQQPAPQQPTPQQPAPQQPTPQQPTQPQPPTFPDEASAERHLRSLIAGTWQ